MRVLFLDDNERRCESFLATCRPATACTVVTTAQAAIEALGNTVYDVVFLDHDLGGAAMAASGPGTGYEVAQFIAEMDNRPRTVIIHSWNPAGAQAMRRCLREKCDVIVFPFATAGWGNFVDAMTGGSANE